MPTYSQVQLQRGKGLTFQEIGDTFGITRQRAHAIFTGYFRINRQMYRKTEAYKEYKRHYDLHLQPKIDCRYCLKDYG